MARWLVQYPGAAPIGPIDASELRAAWARQQVPPNTMVCAEGFSQWVPFHTVAELVGEPPAVSARAAGTPAPHAPPRQDRPPTRAGAVIVGLLVVPVICLVLLTAVFGVASVLGPSLVAVLGVIGAIVVGSSSLRLKTPSELVLMLPFIITVGAVFLAGEGWGFGAGLSAHFKHGNIHNALASSDPCVVPSVTDDEVAELADDAEKRQLQERSESCDAKKAADACAKLGAAMDRGDKTLPPIKDDATADVARRVVTGRLTAADLSLVKSALTCDDAVWMRLVNAGAKTVGPWAGTAPLRVSDDMKSALASIGLSPEVQAALRGRAETLAKAAVNKAKTDDMSDAKSACDLAVAFKAEVGPSCTSLARRFAALSVREEAAAAAGQAAEERTSRGQRSGAFKSCLDACKDRGDTAADVDMVRGCVSECGEEDFACLNTCRRRHAGGTQSDRCAMSCYSKFGQ